MNDLDLLLLEDESEEVETESVEVFEDIVEDYGESKPENPTTPTSDASNFGDIPTAPPTKVETKNPKRIRKVIPGYSTKHARLKKREMLALRAEAKSLEEWLRYLQTKTSGSRISKQRVTNTERRAATKSMEETKRLQRSESINRKLKAVLRDQTKLRKSILAIIQQMTASEDKEFFVGSPCKITESYQNAGVLAQLKDGAHNLYMNLNVAVPQLPSTAYSSVMVSKADPKCGKMFEGSTVCTVSCSMKFAIDALWLEYSTPRKYENKSYRYMDPVGSDAVKKSFDLQLKSKRGAISINGLMFATKFEDKDRVAIVRDYIAFLPTAGLHMRCHHWTIVTPNANGCHIHFYLQMFSETNPNFTATLQDIEYVHEVALEAWSNKMHIYSHLLHDRLDYHNILGLFLVLHKIKRHKSQKYLHSSVADRQSAVMSPSSLRSPGRSRGPPRLNLPRSYSPDTGASYDTHSTPSSAPDSLLSRLEAVDQDAVHRKFARYGRQQAHVDHISGTEQDSTLILQSTMLLQEDGRLAARLDDVTYLLEGLLEPITTQRGRSAQIRSVLELIRVLQDPEILQTVELSSQRRSIQSKVKEVLLTKLRDKETQETCRVALAVLVYFLSERAETQEYFDDKVLDAVIYALKQEQQEQKHEMPEIGTQRAVPLKKTCLKRKQMDAEVNRKAMSTLAISTAKVLDDFYRMQLDELLHDHEAFYVEGELQLSVVDTLCAALHNLLQMNESSSGLRQRCQQQRSTLGDATDDTFQLTRARKRQLVRNGGIDILEKDLAKRLNDLEALLPSTHAEEVTIEFARSLHHVSLLLGVFDQVTFLTLDVQQYISKQRGFFGLLLKLVWFLGDLSWGIDAQKRWDIESTRMALAVDVLLSALRVLINLTHHNTDAASHVHAFGGMELFANTFSQVLTVVSRTASTKRQLLGQNKWEFDSCLLLLSVMVNSIEFCQRNRDALAAASLSVVETTRDEATKPTQAEISACDLFVCFFLAKLQSYKHLIDLTEAQGASAAILIEEEGDNWNPEDVILGGCTSLLIGYLMKGSSANSAAILKALPGSSPRLLLRALGVFVAFHSQIGALTPEVAKSVLHVEKVFKSHQGYMLGADEGALLGDVSVGGPVYKQQQASQTDSIPTIISEEDVDLDSTVSTESSVKSRNTGVSPSLRSRHQLRNVCSNLDDSDGDNESHVTRTPHTCRSPDSQRSRAASPTKTPLQTTGRSPLRTSRSSPIAVLPDGSLSSPVVARLLKRTRQLVEEFDTDFAKLSHSTPVMKSSDGSDQGSSVSEKSLSPCMVFTMDVTCCDQANEGLDHYEDKGEENYANGKTNGVITAQEVEATVISKRRKRSMPALGAGMKSSIVHKGKQFDFVPANTPPPTPLRKEKSKVLLRTPTRAEQSPGMYRQSPSLNLTPSKSSPLTPLRTKKSSGLLQMPTRKDRSPSVMQSPTSDSPHRRKAKTSRIPASTVASSIFDFTD